MKSRNLLFLAAVAGCFAGGAKGEAYGTKEALPRYNVLAAEIWTNALGAVSSWENHNDGTASAVIRHGAAFGGKTVECSEPFSAYGLEIDLPAAEPWVGWWQQSDKPFGLGAGGISMHRGRFFVGNGNPWSTVRLDADQTWTGAADTYFCLGTVYESYFARAVASPEAKTLTVAGSLNACFFAPNNDLSDVTVIVRDSARLWLFDAIDARLNAKKLVLSGDGVRLPFGATLPTTVFHYPVANAISPTNIVAIDHAHLAREVELNDGADISAVGGIYALTNLTVSGTGGSVISGSLTFTQAVNRISFATDGASLRFESANMAGEGVAPGFEVEGPGVLTVTDMDAFTGTVAIGEGATFACSLSGFGPAPVFAGTGTLRISAGADAVVYLPRASLAGFSGPIHFETGTLVLDEPLAEGRLTVDGGSVVYGNSSALIVTDEPVDATEFAVGPGETLLVYGSGLKADTALTVAGGTVKFMCSSTVFSPVTVAAGGAVFETRAGGVEGTFAGAVTAAASGGGGIKLRGEGAIRFSGGGTFSGSGNGVRSYAGTAVFDHGTYTFSDCGAIGLMDDDSSSQSLYARKWLVTGDAVVRAAAVSSANQVRVDFEVAGDGWTGNWAFDRVAELEVSGGGTVELGAHTYLKVGKYFSKGALSVSAGGKVLQTSPQAHILLGYSTMGWGCVNLGSGGAIELSAPIQVQYDKNGYSKGSFDWNGGTLKISGAFPATVPALLGYAGTPGADDSEEWVKSLRIATRISGEDCVLDLSDLSSRESPLANVPHGFDRAEWFGMGTLTVKGGKMLQMNSFASGTGLVLEGDGTMVVFPKGAQFHVDDKREPTFGNSPRDTWYSTFADLEPTLSLKSLGSRGREVSLRCEDTDVSIAVSKVEAFEGGEFANDTIGFPGGVTVGDLTFYEGSVVIGAAAAAALTVTGDITLPQAALSSVRRSGEGGRFAAFNAAGSIVGAPAAWIESGRAGYAPFVDFKLKTIGFIPSATFIFVR